MNLRFHDVSEYKQVERKDDDYGFLCKRITMDKGIIVKTEFAGKRRFDQCGIVMYLDSENRLKASIEYENGEYQRLGSVVTYHGYSDWATTDIPASVKSMWYRFSRRESDYCIECSEDGERIILRSKIHIWKSLNANGSQNGSCHPVAGETDFTQDEVKKIIIGGFKDVQLCIFVIIYYL